MTISIMHMLQTNFLIWKIWMAQTVDFAFLNLLRKIHTNKFIETCVSLFLLLNSIWSQLTLKTASNDCAIFQSRNNKTEGARNAKTSFGLCFAETNSIHVTSLIRIICRIYSHKWTIFHSSYEFCSRILERISLLCHLFFVLFLFTMLLSICMVDKRFFICITTTIIYIFSISALSGWWSWSLLSGSQL